MRAAGHAIIGEGPAGLHAAAIDDKEDEGGNKEMNVRRPAAPRQVSR